MWRGPLRILGALSEGKEGMWTNNYYKMGWVAWGIHEETQNHRKAPDSARWIPGYTSSCFPESLCVHHYLCFILSFTRDLLKQGGRQPAAEVEVLPASLKPEQQKF